MTKAQGMSKLQWPGSSFEVCALLIEYLVIP